MKEFALFLCVVLFVMLAAIGFVLSFADSSALFSLLPGSASQLRIVENWESRYVILAAPEDRLAQAACLYMSGAIREATGAELPLMSERPEGLPCILARDRSFAQRLGDALCPHA